MSWIDRLDRTFFTIAAFAMGAGIVLVLAIAGNKSKGPIENLLTVTGNAVEKVEDKVILRQREYKRADKLGWFDNYMNHVDMVKHPKVIIMGGSDTHTPESYETIINLEDSLHTAFPIIHIYSAWGSKDEEAFPKTQVKAILELGSIPMITWEPWLSDFDADKFPGIPAPEKRDKNCMAAIAKGTYDSYLKQWAEDAKAVGKPIMVRMGHEMNDPYRYPWGPQNNKPKDYVAGWKHVHDVFTSAGATNVIWIWSPHPAYGYFDAFYPGSAYVDYVSVGILNYGTAATWSKWWTFDQMFGQHYAALDTFKKPIMISEFGSLDVGGDRAKWFADALHDMPVKYPSVKSIIFFHYSADKTTTDKAVNWYFKDDAHTCQSIIKEINLWPEGIKPPFDK